MRGKSEREPFPLNLWHALAGVGGSRRQLGAALRKEREQRARIVAFPVVGDVVLASGIVGRAPRRLGPASHPGLYRRSSAPSK